jgi:hypothetical protein
VTDDMDTADVLDAAADYIRAHGWRQNGFGGPDCYGNHNPSCAVGAVRLQEVYSACFINPAVCAVERVVGLTSSCDLAHWNDAPERTADEVITALMEAAARVRLGEIK